MLHTVKVKYDAEIKSLGAKAVTGTVGGTDKMFHYAAPPSYIDELLSLDSVEKVQLRYHY